MDWFSCIVAKQRNKWTKTKYGQKAVPKSEGHQSLKQTSKEGNENIFSFSRTCGKREILLYMGFSLPRQNRGPVDYTLSKSFHFQSFMSYSIFSMAFPNSEYLHLAFLVSKILLLWVLFERSIFKGFRKVVAFYLTFADSLLLLNDECILMQSLVFVTSLNT